MDPKKTNQSLDPKLQAAYDRVMGISLSGNPVDAANPTQGTSSDTSATPQVTPVPAQVSPVSSPTDTNFPSVTPIPTSSPLSNTPSSTTSSPTDTGLTPQVTPSIQPMDNTTPSISPATIPSTDPAAQPNANPTSQLSPTPFPQPGITPQPTPNITVPVSAANPAVVISPTPMEPLSASIPHANETVKIGVGGSVGTTAVAKKKGISPVIIIFAAIAFLVVYAVFWVKFFNYSLPFMPK